MKTRWSVFALTILAFSAFALSAADKAANKNKKSLPPKILLVRDAVIFRKAASNKPSKAVTRFDGDRPLDFLVDSESFQKTPSVWAYFFSGTVMLAGNLESSKPVVAYYNPFLDGVLLTQWTRRGDRSCIVAGDLRIGSEMAGQKSANPALAWWLPEMAKQPLPIVLHKQYTAFLKAFAKEYPAESDSVVRIRPSDHVADSRAILERQSAAVFRNLVELQSPSSPTFSADLQALKKALREKSSKSLEKLVPSGNPMSPEDLGRQPSWIRKQAVPMYALTDSSNTIVLLAPSDAPRYCLLAQYAQAATPHLKMLLPFDVDGTMLSTAKKASNPKE